MKKLDVIGHRYGMLTVIADAEPKAGCTGRRVLCKCDCGTEVIMLLHTLRGYQRTDFIRSCGCVKKQKYKKGLEKRPKLSPELHLVKGIIKQAAEDYRFLRRKGVKQSGFHHNSYSISEIEDFFNSPLCAALLGTVKSDLSGQDILHRLQML